jgi:glutamate/tyrosine decarboxylase-like PLP-dependent enzyme
VYKALAILGLGRDRIESVPVDDQGRMRAEALPELDARTLLVLQAGEVNSGGFDPFQPLCEAARKAGAWIHVDGAFGLWAAASPRFRHLTEGAALADSWSVDAHKTLNAPYDNGIVFCTDREALVGAMKMAGSYIVFSEDRDGMGLTPEMSRRARGIEIWACLKSLGRDGLAGLVDHLCDTATAFATGLAAEGFSIKNEVVFNQVLVACEDQELTRATLSNLQTSGECWCGGTTWRGESTIRISCCSYMTTKEDVDRSIRAFVAARAVARTGRVSGQAVR